MALLALISADTNVEEHPPSGWLTSLGILLLVGMVINEVAGTSLTNSLLFASRGIDFLSIYLPL